jgi:hypothetical protein
MIGTYLVQRLSPPPKSDLHARAEQVFGGTALDLSAEGWRILQQIFSIDYMGAAEYEFGTFSKCLKELAEDKDNLVSTPIVVEAKFIEPNYERKSLARTRRGKPRVKQPPPPPPVTDKVVYLLCRKSHFEGAQEIIRQLAGRKISVKRGDYFSLALDPIGDRAVETCGWLELDNGFFFFLDRTMWRRTTQLFTGVDPAPEQSQPPPP